MEINILNREKNELLNREEIVIDIEHKGEATPKREDIRKKVSAMIGKDEKLIIVEKILSEFGKQRSRAFIHVYDNEEDIKKAAEKIGYPLILKASMGGGGRGIKMVLTPAHLSQAYHQARQEAQSFFGDQDVYLEKFCENPRHVEFQVLADKYGNAVYLGERDCSIQRRHQKIIEEAPSIAVKSAARKKMGALILKVVKEINYVNAATFEFLLDKMRQVVIMFSLYLV